MKHFLIAILLAFTASSSYAASSGRDSLETRPLLMLKTSAMTIVNWRSELSYADIGAEMRIFKSLTFNADAGFYFQSHWSGVPEYTQGFYYDAGLRHYFDLPNWDGLYVSPQYRYQRKKSVQELDFNEAGLPYRKLVDVNRNSHFGLIMVGMNTHYWFDRLYFDWNLGLGFEHRTTDIKGLADFEWEAVNTGEVEGVKWDDAAGRILPAYHFELKIGVRIF